MSKRGEWLAGVVLAGFGVLFAFAALEVGVRMMHVVPDRFWEADPQRGLRLIAGQSGWWSQEDREFLVPIQINRQGLRDVEHTYDKPAGTIRILLLGDSFIEALHVPIEATVGRLLEGELNRQGEGKRYEVISAGVSGYGTAASTLWYEQDLRRYNADLVVLAFYPGNDIKNNSPTLEDYLQPQYDSDGSLLKIVNQQKVPRPSRSKAFQFLRQLILQRQPGLAKRLADWGLFPANALRQAPEHDGIPVDYGVYASEMKPEWEDAWNRTYGVLERLKGDVKASGSRFIVAILSTRDQVYPDLWAEVVRARPAMQGVAWDLNGPQHRIERWCVGHGTGYASLTSDFVEEAAHHGEMLHFKHDGHWTPAGHKLAAGILSKFIRQSGL